MALILLLADQLRTTTTDTGVIQESRAIMLNFIASRIPECSSRSSERDGIELKVNNCRENKRMLSEQAMRKIEMRDPTSEETFFQLAYWFAYQS